MQITSFALANFLISPLSWIFSFPSETIFYCYFRLLTSDNTKRWRESFNSSTTDSEINRLALKKEEKQRKRREKRRNERSLSKWYLPYKETEEMSKLKNKDSRLAQSMPEVVEPSKNVVKAVGPTGVVVNTVGILGFKQPVLVKLSNVPTDCTSVDLELGTNETCLDSNPTYCLPSSSTFKHDNNLYTLAICLPLRQIEQTQLQHHKPFTILNRNTVVNVSGVSEEKTKPFFERPVLVNLNIRLESSILSKKPIVVPVELIAQKHKNKLPLMSGRIFIFNPNSLSKKFSKVMNHFFVAEKDPAGTMHSQIVLCGTDTKVATLFSNGDIIGQAVLFVRADPDHIQRCLISSTLQAGE